MNKIKLLSLFAASTIVAIFAFKLLFLDTQYLGGLKLPQDPQALIRKSADFARDEGLSIQDASISPQLSANDAVVSYMQSKYGVKEGNKYLRDSVPGYYWNIKFKPKGASDVKISTSQEKKDTRFEEYLNSISLHFDTRGKLVKFYKAPEDSALLPKVTPGEAKKIAADFIRKYRGINDINLRDTSTEKEPHGTIDVTMSFGGSGFNFDSERKTEHVNRTDYEFAWSGNSNLHGVKKVIKVTVSGTQVSSFGYYYNIDETYKKPDMHLYDIFSKIIFYLVIFILLLIIAIKRIRAYEIGFRLAFIMGIITAVCVGIELYMELKADLGLELILPLILGPAFMGVAILLIWAPSETITREVWKEKFISLDLATKGYILHSRVGTALLKGGAFGLLIASASLLLSWLFENIFGMTVVLDNNDFLQHFNSMSPAFSLLFKNIYGSLFLVGVFFIFIVSGLKRRFHSVFVLTAICSVLWGLTNAGDMQPIYLGILFQVLIGAAFVYLFIKTDVFATLTALTTSAIVSAIYPMFTVQNSSYSSEGYVILIIAAFTVAIAVISLFTRDKVFEFDSITPAFAKNITERQRLQRELEIARDVQMSFLPKTIPSFPGLQVASRCIPALEVGGDYYDFVCASDSKFGIIIGDVSGKGTQAAFYMTLTKGFLKALSRTSDSPAAVLSKMNELFYENVERGTFISMIYGIFDNDRKMFKLARAGHNPVIVKTSPGKIEMLNPIGLALGMEKGSLFTKTIKEFEVPYAPGDIFIFYTDGFTEAMNKQKEEFGEERLKELVSKTSDLSADEILNTIIKDVKTFIGKASQHDDMTMVVVKVI